jgi:hypothetical protein
VSPRKEEHARSAVLASLLPSNQARRRGAVLANLFPDQRRSLFQEYSMSLSPTRFLSRYMLVVALAAGMAACKSSSDASPATPSPTYTTESFSGTLTQGATATHTFTVKVSDSVVVGLSEVGPLSTLALGVGIGTWNATTTTCSIVGKNDAAKAGTTALTGTAGVGNFCVQVYDSGNVTADMTVTYTVQVAHP